MEPVSGTPVAGTKGQISQDTMSKIIENCLKDMEMSLMRPQPVLEMKDII